LQRIHNKANFNAVILALSTVMWTSQSLAYIDPGSGSIIMSAIISGLVASGIFLKTFWSKLTTFLNPKSSRAEQTHQDQPEGEDL